MTLINDIITCTMDQICLMIHIHSRYVFYRLNETYQPANQLDDSRVHREVTLPMIVKDEAKPRRQHMWRIGGCN